MKKNYIILSLLGALWGVVETQFGTLLHLADLPFVGLVMMAFGIFFQTTARLYTHTRGSALLMAAVVAFLKFLFVGGIAFSTVVAIFIQSLILELVYFTASPSRWRMMVGGALSVSYALLHPFLSMPVFMRLTVVDAYNRIIGGGSALLGLPKESGLVIFAALLLLHLGTGLVAAFFSFHFAEKLQTLHLASSSTKK